MGLEDLRIEDSQITALSYQKILSVEGKEIETGPKCARLHNSFCAWCAQPVNGQYIQVDLHQESIVTGISTQGFEALSDNYVTSYNISHSRDGHIWSIFPVSISLTFCAINSNDGDDNSNSNTNNDNNNSTSTRH